MSELSPWHEIPTNCINELNKWFCLFLKYHDGAYTPVLDATFVMVARDPENKR